MIKVLKSQEELEAVIEGQSLSFVPTMGALHQGHLSLMQKAREFGDKVIVSIFVNPLQFSQGEDFDQYPRDLEKDAELIGYLADYLWAPSHEDIYPQEPEIIKANPELADKLCGLSRPGHFDGVCTVVKALFDAVKPKRAIFGEKDYQQLMVIKDMVEAQEMPVEIIPAPIVREPGGLALSSRNQYLTESERELAQNLHKQISAVANGEFTIEEASENLKDLGFKLEYLEEHWSRVLVAVKLGRTRLIDNV